MKKNKYMSFEKFVEELEKRLVSLNFSIRYSGRRTSYSTLYYDKKIKKCEDYDFFIIEKYYTNISFTNNEENNPEGCWHSWGRDWSQEKLDLLFKKAETISQNAKKFYILNKLDELKEDFK